MIIFFFFYVKYIQDNTETHNNNREIPQKKVDLRERKLDDTFLEVSKGWTCEIKTHTLDISSNFQIRSILCMLE